MREDRRLRPPALCRLLVYAAGWVAPRGRRGEWRARWKSILGSWWLLVQRGECIDAGRSAWIARGREAFGDAAELRFGRQGLQRIARSPHWIPAGLSAAALFLALGSQGFVHTRALLGAGGEALVAHAAVLAFALVTALVMALKPRLSLKNRGWRYGTYLAAKAAVLAMLVTLLWIESGAALRQALPAGASRALLGGLVPTLLFLAALPLGVAWSIADQQQRCPACLSRLILPVRIGTWSSMIEPPVTERLCPNGHGALCAPETECGADDHWITHEDSRVEATHG